MGVFALRRVLAWTLATALLAGCTKASPPGGATAEGGRHPYTIPHVLRYASAEDITGLNPHLVSQNVVSFMSSMTMAWLVKSDRNGKLVPELSTEIPTLANRGIGPDGKTFTWHLRRDAKWSDGVPFTADDVVFSIKTILNPANNELTRDGWDLIERIEEPDKYTVRLHLKKPYSPYAYTYFASTGANPCILPAHLLGKLANINTAAYNSLPVGIGPFKYVRWTRGDSVELAPDPNYFRGRAKLQKILFKIIPDRNTVLTQMQSHELDLWIPMSPNYYDRVKAVDGLNVVHAPAFQYDHLDFNVSHPAVADPAVRSALRYALDREELRQKVRHGLGTLSDNVLGPTHVAYHPIPLTPFDLSKANRILDGAGWKRGSDGIRAKGGVRLALDFATSAGTPDTDTQIELIRANWKKIGVDITVKHYLASLLFALGQQGGIVLGGKFDVAVFAWIADGFGDLSGLFGCAMIPPAGQNDVHWCDRSADAAMNAFKLEYDEKKRVRYDWLVTDRIAQAVPTIVLDIRDEIWAVNSDLTGWHPNTTAPFDDMLNVDI